MAPAGIAAIPEVASEIVRNADSYRDAFVHGDPFKHVVIEGFFEPSFAERLLADFPSFNPRLATNELGMTARKAVNTNIREISPVYQQLYEAIGSKPFLDLVSRISGIPGLILDPKMYGGGTHDNQHGQELDPHVDFNYDESQKLHRRLNLIVYMNKEWESEWGGALEIHSNPRDPATNRISSYDPLFNRCVMFETNERSWHGFPKINLPEGKRHLSRKSISIYLYTKDRPPEEIAPMHGTFYVQRPLPKQIAAGHTLTEADAENLRWLLKVRDGWIQSYQRMELEKNREIADKGRVDWRVEEPRAGPVDRLRSTNGLIRIARRRLGGFARRVTAKPPSYRFGNRAARIPPRVRPRGPVADFDRRSLSRNVRRKRRVRNEASAAAACAKSPFSSKWIFSLPSKTATWHSCWWS